MMSGAYSRWILVANLIAWPIAYFFANKWLQGFAYRTSLTLFTFVLAAILSSAVALLTVSYQSIKAATVNPIDSLRYE
jgi:putative ABC transport system permease protein